MAVICAAKTQHYSRMHRAAAALVAALQDSAATAREWCDDHAPPRPAAMTPEACSHVLPHVMS